MFSNGRTFVPDWQRRSLTVAGVRRYIRLSMTLMPGREALVGPEASLVQEPAFTRQTTEPRYLKIILTATVIAVVSALLLFSRINHPPTECWDEGIYVGIARSLLNGTLGPLPQKFSPETHGRQHPPLTPYLIAAGIKIAGDNPTGWRLMSVGGGVLTVVAIFFWVYLLLRDYFHAVIAAGLTLINNFLYVIARTAMPDVFLFMFVIWGVLAFTMALELEIGTGARRALMACSGLLFGLGVACKWNAVDTYGAVLVITLALVCCGKYIPQDNRRLRRSADNLKTVGLPTLVLALIMAPLLAYTLTFLPLFRAMHTPFSIPALAKMHLLMLTLTKAAPGNPVHFAAWYSWPFRFSPTRGFSYLLGNPVVMWGGVFAIVVCARRLWKCVSLAEGMIFCLYAANLLQWAVTPIKVPLYYYYYPAAMFLSPAIATALNGPAQRKMFGVRLSFLVVLAASVVFLYCYQRMAYLEAPWDCMFGCWN